MTRAANGTIGPSSSSLVYRGLWWACVPLLPILKLQGRSLRKRVPRLPEAEGPFEGQMGAGRDAGLNVTLIGESSVAGVGVKAQNEGLAVGVARALAESSGRATRWQAVGKTGATLGSTLKTLLPRVHLPPDSFVVVALGINDAVFLTRQSKWMEGVRTLTRTLLEMGAQKVIYSSVPPLGHFPALRHPLRAVMGVRAQLLDARLRETTQQIEGAHYCQIYWPEPRRLMAHDGFHPSAQGYAEWGRQIGVELTSMVSPADLLTSTAR